MTLREVSIVLDGAAWRNKYDADLATTTAWYTAALMRHDRKKRLPSLMKLLGYKAQKPEPQSIEQQAAIIRALHERWGGTLTADKA